MMGRIVGDRGLRGQMAGGISGRVAIGCSGFPFFWGLSPISLQLEAAGIDGAASRRFLRPLSVMATPWSACVPSVYVPSPKSRAVAIHGWFSP